jgi:hypothetical protein
MFDWYARQPYHDESRDDKSEEARHQPLPTSAPDRIKTNKDETHPHQQASEKPKSRMRGLNTLAHGPPQPAEENEAEQKSSRQRQHPA